MSNLHNLPIITTDGSGNIVGLKGQSSNILPVNKMPYVVSALAGISLVGIATTFIGAYTITSEAGGTQTGITSSGVHGLTAANAVGHGLGIISGTGWEANSFPNITALDVDSIGVKVTVDVPYSGSMGSPVIALAGTAVAKDLCTLAPNALGPNGSLRSTFYWKVHATGSYSGLNFYLNGQYYGQDGAMGDTSLIGRYAVINQNNAQVQKSFPEYSYIDGGTGGDPQAYTIDTTTPRLQQLSLYSTDIDSYVALYDANSTVYPS
jgi:hypothetical protein